MVNPTRTSTVALLLATSWTARTVLSTDEPVLCGDRTCVNGAVCIEEAPDYESHMLPDGSLLDIHSTQALVHCSCHPGWTGPYCDVAYEGCDGTDHKCYHGGECVLGLIDMYDNEQLYCNCDNAKDDDGNRYVGKYCEQKSMSYCDPYDNTRFCLNNGVCNEQYPVVGKSCNCENGYIGAHCEYEEETVPQCDLECLNGGQCLLGTPSDDKLDGYSAYWDIAAKANEKQQYCQCANGFYGENCEVYSEECGESKCFYGSKCTESVVNGATLHHCDCRFANTDFTSYAGRSCQYEATSYCDKGHGTSMNGHLFCVNGGKCQQDAFLGCSCLDGYRGFSCEYNMSETSPPNNSGDDTNLSDPVEEAKCILDCNGQGTCRKGIKDVKDEVAGHAEHLTNESSLSSDSFEHCVCDDGWTGLQCEHAVEVCEGGEYHCFHGGECESENPEQKCDCSNANSTDLGTTAFAGDLCQHPATDICTEDKDSLTYNLATGLSFCVNYGTCRKKVKSGEPHAGCDCDETKWTGPHCEVKVGQPAQAPAPSTTNADEKGDRNVFQILMIMVLVFVLFPFVAFFLVQRYRNRRKSRDIPLDQHALRLRQTSQGGYRDEPNFEINLSPRRRSTFAEHAGNKETAAVAASASSRDPFAAHLVAPPPLNAAFSNDSYNDGGPQVYLGPPQDEDGHVLHSVEIL